MHGNKINRHVRKAIMAFINYITGKEARAYFHDI